MTHDTLMKTCLVISVILNLFYVLSAMPEAKALITFWKKQADYWMETYYKLLRDGEKIEKPKNGSGPKD
jgi:hypothetical protein